MRDRYPDYVDASGRAATGAELTEAYRDGYALGSKAARYGRPYSEPSWVLGAPKGYDGARLRGYRQGWRKHVETYSCPYCGTLQRVGFACLVCTAADTAPDD